MSFDTSLAAARGRDAADPLRHRRAAFALPDGRIYLDGNSLGVLPATTPDRLAALIRDEWGRDLIGSWNTHRWIEAPARVGATIAPLIGAQAHEVIAADSTSVNIYKLLVAACLARPERRTILSEPGNFPTDLYVASGVAATLGDRRLVTLPVDEIANAIDLDTAVVLLTHVHYKSGQRLDMATLTAKAHAAGALVVWDLSHSVGAVEVDLNAADADFAVGCGYKYLNGGPGAPAFLYVAERLHGQVRSPLSGWMGHAEPFAFVDDYRPATGVAAFLCGTPPIIGLAALEEGVRQFDGVAMADVVAKSAALCDLYIALVEERCADDGFTLLSPRDPHARGSHVSFVHDHAHAVCQALIERGVIGDFRAPDVLRTGFTPLYTSFEDVWRAVDVLADVMRTAAWREDRFHQRAAVT